VQAAVGMLHDEALRQTNLRDELRITQRDERGADAADQLAWAYNAAILFLMSRLRGVKEEE